MTTVYEFVVETLDWYDPRHPDPDIIDVNVFDTLADAQAYTSQLTQTWRVALRRDRGNNVNGMLDRFYAYPDRLGTLPYYFESCQGAKDGPVVPARFEKLRLPVDRRIPPPRRMADG